mmetsp:Transcript_34786/g.85130  ORF Transcript_34786/g.85130 Transcript_34786/m.85130 type:complete len:150 (-) Transcript_34786:46-495(-)
MVLALLYERSALWRWVVLNSKGNPLFTAVFSVVTCAGFYGLGKGTMWLSNTAQPSREEMELQVKKDPHAEWYAGHSREAMRALIEQTKSEKADIGSSTNLPKSALDRSVVPTGVKIPGVAWHPAVGKKQAETPKSTPSASTPADPRRRS